jgi:glycosyltransferase involved in cell wall biosynthesis
VIDSTLSAEDYIRFYRAADCYVIPSRGEGWGMPVTEAMSMSLPVIVTGWSGTADIVNDDVGYLIDYKLTEVKACI